MPRRTTARRALASSCRTSRTRRRRRGSRCSSSPRRRTARRRRWRARFAITRSPGVYLYGPPAFRSAVGKRRVVEAFVLQRVARDRGRSSCCRAAIRLGRSRSTARCGRSACRRSSGSAPARRSCWRCRACRRGVELHDDGAHAGVERRRVGLGRVDALLGAPVKSIVLGDEPSAFGHGPSRTRRGRRIDTGRRWLELELVDTGLLSLPLRREITKITPTMATTINPKFRTVRHRCRRLCSAIAAATRAWRPSRWRSRLAEGMNAKSYCPYPRQGEFRPATTNVDRQGEGEGVVRHGQRGGGR